MNVKTLFGQDLTYRIRIRENLRRFQAFAPCDKYKLSSRGEFRLNLVEKRCILFNSVFICGFGSIFILSCKYALLSSNRSAESTHTISKSGAADSARVSFLTLPSTLSELKTDIFVGEITKNNNSPPAVESPYSEKTFYSYKRLHRRYIFLFLLYCHIILSSYTFVDRL